MVRTTFYETTDQKCRGAILDLLSVLTRAGLNCSIIDSPERTFLLGALAQYQESNEAYFPNASKENLGGLLCFAQEMFVTRGNLEKVWKSGILSNIIELPQSVTSRVSWKTVFGGLAEATPMLFSAEDSDYLSYYIEKILKVVIRRLEPQTTQRMTTKFITQMLLLSKTHNKRWNSLSIISIESIMKYTNAPRLRDYDDVWRLCSLWRIVCPSAIEQVNWKSLVCSCPEPQEAQQDLTTEISQGSRLDTVLNRLGLSWLPGFVVGSRVGAENMPKEVLSKYTKDIGEKKLLESITKSVDLSVSRSIGLYHIESLKLCVIAVIDSARNLLARLKDVSQEDSFDTSLFFEDQLDKFCSLLNKDIVPGSVKGALCKYMRTLYQIEKAEKPLSRLFYALEANKDHKNDFLIDELSFYLSRCLEEKVPAMDQNVIEKIMMSGNKNTHRTLKGLFAPQNIETTFKVVETWAQRGDTYKGAEVYFSMIMQLPKSMETFELIANNLGHAKVGLLCVKLEKVLLGILKRVAKHTGKDRLSAAYEKIVSSTSDMSFVKLKAQLQKTLGGAQDNSHIFQSLTATKQPSSPEERDQEVEAREKETLVKCILKQIKLLAGDKTEAVSSLVELGGSYFKDVLFSGRLDKVIVPYVTRTENDTAKDVVCGYVKSIMNNEAEGPEHDFWEKDILACTLIDALEGEILMHVTYDELVPFVARVTCSFVERWRTASAKAASPPATLFDFCMIMRVTIFALFDNARVTLDDPEVSKLVAGLYDAYSCVVLPQNLQAASVITRGLRQEGGTPEGKLRAFLAAQIVGGLAELEIFGKPFVHTLVLLEFTLARKFTGVLFPLPPRGAAANGKAGRIQDMPIYRMCQVHESPELALRIALNFISTAGVNSAREFYWVHKGLCSILSDTDNSSEISDELKCLALRGVTSLIVNACIHDTREERRKLILDPAVYAVKREYGLRRAKMINESMPLEEVMSLVDGKYAEVLGEDPGEQGSEGTASPSPLSSPKDEEAAAMSLRKQGVTDLNEMIKALFNIEHDKEAEFGAKLGYDPLPLSELSKKRTFHWSGLNVSRTILDFMCILDRILDVQALLEVEGDALRLTNLQCEAVHSLVVLSDVLVPAQSMWLFDNCLQLFDLLQYASADFALMRNLVVGVLKAAAQTNTPTPAVVDAINRVVYYSLLSDRIVVANGALLGLRFVMQASGREAFMPADLITVVTYYINEMVRTAQPEGTMLHLLSAGFDLIQAFPKASEELGFTETFTANAIAMCRTSSSLSSSSSRVVVQHIYKNLRLLLLCDAIDQSKRILIEDFALRALQGQGQPLRDSLAMGLLFTSMYARKDAFSLYASKRRGPKGAAEERRRFQTIFDYIKRQSDMQMTSPRLVDVLSQMMADLLTPEKSLELVLGELLGAPQSSRRVIARVMNRVLAMVEDKNEVFKTISVYVTKFGQDTPAATAAWLAACTLLSVSSDSTAMHNVFNYVLYEEDSVNNEILSLAAREALNVFKLEYNKRELATTLKKVYGVDV